MRMNISLTKHYNRVTELFTSVTGKKYTRTFARRNSMQNPLPNETFFGTSWQFTRSAKRQDRKRRQRNRKNRFRPLDVVVVAVVVIVVVGGAIVALTVHPVMASADESDEVGLSAFIKLHSVSTAAGRKDVKGIPYRRLAVTVKAVRATAASNRRLPLVRDGAISPDTKAVRHAAHRRSYHLSATTQSTTTSTFTLAATSGDKWPRKALSVATQSKFNIARSDS
jgi:hypothetical protein